MLKSEMGIDVMFGVSGGRVSSKARERKKIGSNRRGKGLAPAMIPAICASKCGEGLNLQMWREIPHLFIMWG